jgi:hypothetical protein
MKDEISVPDCGIGIYIEPGMVFGSESHETMQLYSYAAMCTRHGDV